MKSEVDDDDEIKIADNDEIKEQLNTTFEIEADKYDQGDNAVEAKEIETKEEKDNVKDLLEVMRPEMTDEEMKAELMAAIDKKVQNRKGKFPIGIKIKSFRFISHLGINKWPCAPLSLLAGWVHNSHWPASIALDLVVQFKL